ncbi:outer membrane protein assembly factor BamE [Cupriavidus gilardii]|uniref:Outer membrane protein assembly factor BamE n=4 Tax=Cupriavidus gilardii TaxID=82541 RepID=A0ABY4W0V1_9BURK|nr:outer membrane protein assembly factor BamE [Cupriavidus gilardii]ALD91536.1 Small protein A (tmRNA-binding) [Cupriavidus gilardii CR3]QQE06504.1 outer membrane protein assembly factor BamE [Cupriavidus sp. ISTL7]MCT9074747.1 outer membrane protein assembly factor BamE [Cupriavidus gilardii]MCT9115267.1 outer membrane protein assembly factor BamE [Cupriavidus gilardii]MCT9123993.1 outer membrane protein assembly factor BamE [Cupriavidus gilardii]
MDSIRTSALRPALLTTLLAAITLASAACSTYDSTSRKIANAITPYRINIVQGNFVSREAAAQLREGMTRDQVQFLLGTPLLTDVFHANRWDYVFSFKRGNTQVVQQRRFTVFFDNDRLVRFGGDELPSEYELIAEIDGMKRTPEANKGAKSAPQQAAAPAEPQAQQGDQQAPADAAQPQAQAQPSASAPEAAAAPAGAAPSQPAGEPASERAASAGPAYTLK